MLFFSCQSRFFFAFLCYCRTPLCKPGDIICMFENYKFFAPIFAVLTCLLLKFFLKITLILALRLKKSYRDLHVCQLCYTFANTLHLRLFLSFIYRWILLTINKIFQLDPSLCTGSFFRIVMFCQLLWYYICDILVCINEREVSVNCFFWFFGLFLSSSQFKNRFKKQKRTLHKHLQ